LMPARPLLLTGTGPIATTLDTKLNSPREKSFMCESPVVPGGCIVNLEAATWLYGRRYAWWKV
jgi:hypothetical protein